MKIGAFSFILDAQSRVLLGLRRDKDLWNLPGGGAEEGESPWDAAIREAKEEVGVDVEIEKLVGVFFNQKENILVFQFVARITKGEPSTSEEAREVAYFDPNDLPPNTAPRQAERIRLYFEDPTQVRFLAQ